MSEKNDKRIRKEVDSAFNQIYAEIKKQINALPFFKRLSIARKIRRGRW